jgi:hypothetical protein
MKTVNQNKIKLNSNLFNKNVEDVEIRPPSTIGL